MRAAARKGYHITVPAKRKAPKWKNDAIVPWQGMGRLAAGRCRGIMQKIQRCEVLPLSDMLTMAASARLAALELAVCPIENRNAALQEIARALEAHREDIFTANREDLLRSEAEGLPRPFKSVCALMSISSRTYWPAYNP
jgi:hypothetical protein